MVGVVVHIKVYSPLKLLSGLTGKPRNLPLLIQFTVILHRYYPGHHFCN